MVDRLQDSAGAIGDISILPVERDAVVRAVHVVEAQCAAASRDCELLIEGAISQWFVIVLLAKGVLLRVAACECRKRPGVRLRVGDYRIVDVAINYPAREVTG